MTAVTSSAGASLRAKRLSSIGAVVLALLLCFLGLCFLRGNVSDAAQAYLEMLWGGLGDFPRFLQGGPWSALTRPWGESLNRSAILLLTGLSITAAFSVGLFNVGAQGQLLWGALAAAVLGAHLSLPPVLHAALCILGAALAGAAWSLPAAVLKVKRGVHEVISTIMLNWMAVALIENWLVVGPLRASSAAGVSRSGTEEIASSAALPRLLEGGSRLHAGVLLAGVLCMALWYWLFRTRSGFECRAVGQGAQAARASGIPVEARTLQGMALSGALAGIAGALVVLGTELKYPPTMGAPYGFDGIALALIGQSHPFGVAASALTFGILRSGGPRMQLVGVHRSLPELIQGIALILVAAPLVWVWVAAKVTPRAPVSKSGAANG